MGQRGFSRWSPVARFSVALALVLVVTAVALGGLTAFLIGRYVEDETVNFTQDAVAGHFGTVFQNSVFQRPLTVTEEQTLEQTVVFHFSIYNVVSTRFYAPDGTIVFSYDDSEIGRRLDPVENPNLAAALAGQRVATDRTIVADVRYAKPGFTYSEPAAAPATGDHSDHGGVTLSSPDVRPVQTLESWVPVISDGKVIGAVTVWRDIEPLQMALWNMQAGIGLIIAAAAVLLWLVLRGVYTRSSKQIVSQATALRAALAENERTYDATLAALSSALDVRDTETEGHARRVVRYMELIAEGLNVPVEQHATLRRGALLHDIGKIGVPDHILRKPGPLTENEWYTMKTHPDLGRQDHRERPVPRGGRGHHPRPPRALGWERVPRGPRRRADPARRAHLRGGRQLRRDDLRPAVPPRPPARRSLLEIDRCSTTQFDPRS